MRHFKWSQENEVFVAQIDAEHRDLFRIADGLQQALAANSRAAGVKERWGTPRPAEPAPAEATETGPFPRTVRFCKACDAQTTHEIRSLGLICLKCAERSVSADLDRE